MTPRTAALAAALVLACAPSGDAPPPAAPPGPLDWSTVEAETLEHFQALLRMDTRDPPGNEKVSSDYLVAVLRDAGIEVQTYALEPDRPNVVARLRGNGSKRPLLIMAHQDVVNVDTTKWRFPPFSATRDSGWVYGRGAVDDKDNLAAGLMLMLMLKRQQVPLDRDVIFLAESGEEGSVHVGIKFMVENHFDAIEAEYCLAEGGGVTRIEGTPRFARVSTTEKIPRAIQLTARGTSGHGSVPLESNAVLRMARALARFDSWRPPVQLTETTREYFRRLAEIAPPERRARYLDVVSGDARRVDAADAYLRRHEPSHASMLRTSLSPTIVQGGYRVNVIPSEVTATVDVRMMPGTDTVAFLETIRQLVNDTAVTVAYQRRDVRPGTPAAALSSEAFRVLEAATRTHYNTVTLPTMLTGATDMAYLRARGVECYGIGPGIDEEDGPRGFGAHSDQERILEAELHRFVRFQWDVVQALARTGGLPAAPDRGAPTRP